jgi:electron transfer flavoprotein beta subunit
MKALVAVKRVVDYNVRIRVKNDGSGVDLDGVKMSMNPFDEIAVEEAIRKREAGQVSEVVVASIGPAAVQETLRTALALGADRAIHIQASEAIEPIHAAGLLAAVVKQEQPGLVILGKQAIDDDAGQTGQMLAALLGWPQGTFASKLELRADHAIVTREVDEGLKTIRLTLPCVITTDLRLNEPRYVTLPNIMKAKSKPLAVVEAASLGVSLAPRQTVVRVAEPAKRQGGGRVASVGELVQKLKAEAKVL